jgi:filamentous hemagglutinin family protein
MSYFCRSARIRALGYAAALAAVPALSGIETASAGSPFAMAAFTAAPQATADFLQPSTTDMVFTSRYDTDGSPTPGHLATDSPSFLLNPNGMMFGTVTQASVAHGNSRQLVDFSFRHDVTANVAVYVNVLGQWSASNLDPAERMILGGPYTVRGYDLGIETGDNGVLASVEIRHKVAEILRGPLEAVTFLDTQHVTLNPRTWSIGSNSATASGTGLGLIWSGSNLWRASVYSAAPIGTRSADLPTQFTPGSRSTRRSERRVSGKLHPLNRNPIGCSRFNLATPAPNRRHRQSVGAIMCGALPTTTRP